MDTARQLHDENFLRNVREYASVYNELTERCFQSCVYSLSSRELTPQELTCTDNCASKLLNASGQMVKKVSELNPTQIGQPSPVPNR